MKAKEVGERIKEIRGSRSRAAFAALVSLSDVAILNYENGRVPSLPILEKIAAQDTQKRGVDWILTGRGSEGAIHEHGGQYGRPVSPGIPEDIPLVGSARGGRGKFSHDGYPAGEGWKKVRRPYDVLDKNAFAVLVEGDSMAPRYEKGDIVICSPAKGWRQGDYCVVVTHDDESLIKCVHDRDGHFILSSIAPGYEPLLFEKKQIRAIHKIVWRKEK